MSNASLGILLLVASLFAIAALRTFLQMVADWARDFTSGTSRLAGALELEKGSEDDWDTS